MARKMILIDAVREAGLTMVIVFVFNCADACDFFVYGRTNYFAELTILQAGRHRVILR